MNHKTIIKRIIDVTMSIIMLFLMAYQVTGQRYHEWLGAIMLVLFLIHNILNIKWYQNLWKGKYSITRVLWTIINIATLVAIAATGYSGMAMSRYVFSALDLSTGALAARSIHLAGCYWSFVLMSCHLGLHWNLIVTNLDKKMENKKYLWNVFRLIALVIAVYGAVRFYQQDIYAYMFMQNPFAYLDYDKASILVLFENAMIMGSFIFITYYGVKGIQLLEKKNTDNKKTVLICIGVAAVIFLMTFVNFFGVSKDNDWGNGTFGKVDNVLIEKRLM